MWWSWKWYMQWGVEEENEQEENEDNNWEEEEVSDWGSRRTEV